MIFPHQRHPLRKIRQAENKRLHQQETIAWLGTYAIACRDLDELFHRSIELVSQTLNVEMCKVLELLPDGSELLLRAGVGWKDGLVGTAAIGSGTNSQAGFALLNENPIIVRDLRTETRFSDQKFLAEHDVVSGMSVVIHGREKPFGVLGAHTCQLRWFSAQDARFLKNVANILASAIERWRVEDELRRSRDELEIILNGISEGITAQDLDGNLVYANETAAEIMGLPSAQALLQTPIAQVMKRFRLLKEDGSPFPIDELPGRRVLRGEPGTAVRMRFLNIETGQEAWSVASARAVLDPEQKPILAVNIFRNITETVRRDQAQTLLAETGRLLSSPLEYSTTLQNIANLAVRHLADWCTVHLADLDGKILQAAVAHKNPARLALAEDLQRRYPADPERESGVGQVLKTGEPLYIPEITGEMLENGAIDPEHLAALQELGLRSALTVPMIARGRTLGAISLVWAESGRRFSESDVELAKEMAYRAALAIDNARLFEDVQSINRELEVRVARRTLQLEKSHERLIQEIEERRRIEIALRDNEVILNSLFESAPDATILINQSGRIVRVNRQAEVLFGYERDELVGKDFEILLPPRLRARHAGNPARYFQQSVTRPMGAGLDLYGLRKDKTEVAVDIMLSPVQVGSEAMVVTAIRDITVQKKLQTDLTETHRRLFDSLEAERLSLSQELHDGPMQELYTVVFNLEGVKSSLTDPDALENLHLAKDSVQGVIQTLRNISGELRPPTLTHFGLEKAILSHQEKIQRANPELRFQVNLAGDKLALPERIRLVLYRVYQSAVSNSLRHAHASQINLTFTLDEKSASLIVQDDGQGFTLPDKWVELARTGHFGLVGMAERVSAVGGELVIISEPGKGTTIQVKVPREAVGGTSGLG